MTRILLRSRAAFTHIELIVVIVILSVVAATVAPRFAGDGSRRAEQAARNIRNLLSIAAHRDSLGSERISVAYDTDSKSLKLETHRGVADGARAWRMDPLTAAADLGPLTLRSAAIDSQALDSGAFRLEFPEHEPRGLIELTLERPGTSDTWNIVLLPGAVQADMSVGGAPTGLVRPIDLDSEGSGASPW